MCLEKLISGRIHVPEEKILRSDNTEDQTTYNDFKPMILFDAAAYTNFKGCLPLLWSSVLFLKAV